MAIFKNRRFYLLILFALLLGFLVEAYWDTNTITVKKYQIDHPSLGEIFSGLKVAHLSDLHIKQIGFREKKIFDILERERPDLIFLTGDYIKYKSSFDSAMSFFGQLKAPGGIYAVLGNTDYHNENDSCRLCHQTGSKQLKINPSPAFLRNSRLEIKFNGRKVIVCGVDDPVTKRADLKLSLGGKDLTGPKILLAHSPEIFSEAVDQGIDLLLCGHNHGGQIVLVKYLKNVFPLDPSLKFLSGFFQEGKTLMYVNQGVGTSALPFRF
jgi:predicted MPP superfamily phosphohydrolase